MLIEINRTGDNVPNDELETLRSFLRDKTERFAPLLTRIEVYFKDANGPKGGVDKHCTLEARMSGRTEPVAVTAESTSIDLALNDATSKLVTVLNRLIEKIQEKR